MREDIVIQNGKEQPYTVVERADSSTVIVLTETGRTILEKQFRHPLQSFSWELPMGGVESNESFPQAAIRELKEETNLKADELIKIGEHHVNPGLSPQLVSVFIAKVKDTTLNEVTLPKRHDDIVEYKILPIADVYAMVKNGNITDGFSISALALLQLSDQL